jgi:hypothetical protein
MDFSILDGGQRQQWQTFTNGLSHLNRLYAKSRFDLWWIKRTIEFYKQKTEALPPSFNFEEIAKWQGIATRWMRGVSAINNAFALTQSGNAFLSPSKMEGGDLDIVVEKDSLPADVVQNATFISQDIPTLELAPLIPLLIKAGVVIVTVVLVSGIVKSINETILKHKGMDVAIEKIKSGLTNDMKDAGPDIFKQFTEMKKAELDPAQSGFMANLKGAMGGIVGIGIVAIVLLIAWKSFTGDKK